MTINIGSLNLGTISQFTTVYLFGVLSAIAVVAFWLKNPEIFQKWIGILAGWLSYFFKGLEKFSDKYEFQGRINEYLALLENHAVTQLPRLTIKFTGTKKDGEEFVWEENNVIIVMHDRKHRTRNFVHAAHFYTAEVLLRKSKLYLAKKQKEALDLFSTKEVLRHTYSAAEEQFVSDYVVPSIEQNEEIRNLLAQFDVIARKGLYFAILIQELTFLGHKVFLQKPKMEIMDEVNRLVEFLRAYSLRGDGDTNVSEYFFGKYMRCTIKIVAATPTREKGETIGHRYQICQAVKNGFENIYLIGANSPPNCEFISRVVDAVLHECPDVEEGQSRVLHGRIKIHGSFKEVDTYFIPLHNPNAVKYFYSEEDLTDAEI